MLVPLHVFTEVEMICNRVVIIHEGRIVADDTQEGLIESMSDARKLFVELKGTDPRPAEKLLEETEGIVRYYIASREEVLKLEIEQEEGYDLREELSVKFSGLGYIVLELRSERYTLEDIFSMLTSEKFVEADADEQEEVTEGEVSGEEAESDAAESDDGPQTDEAAQEGEQSDSDEEKEGDESPARHVADTIRGSRSSRPRREQTQGNAQLIRKACRKGERRTRTDREETGTKRRGPRPRTKHFR
ncbi:MAG: hypothetical protein U5N86_06585 [Planctomycetota bacterium]|nr:hypothetical protein [Planctomycetota bacterium]